MKIGRETVPRTAICTSDEHTIVIRGRDLSKELIGKVSFIEHFFLLLVGRMPAAGEAAVLNATLVAIAEHGLVPSVQAARMTFAAAPDALQGAVAAGILGCGSVVLGSSETAGRLYGEIDAKMQQGVAADLHRACAFSAGCFASRKSKLAEWYGSFITRPSTAVPGGCFSKSTTRLSRLPNTASWSM